MSAKVLVIGNVNVDLVMGPQAPWPRPGTEVLVPHSELRVGGAAGNVALALEALALPHRLIASRGDDVMGRWLLETLPGHALGLPVAAAPTTISVGITHPGGERTFFTSPGHLDIFDLACVASQVRESAAPGAVALLVGTFVAGALLPDYAALIALLRDRGYAIALDTGWPSGGWTEAVRTQVMAWLPFCDHLLINEIETEGLAGIGGVEAAARRLVPRLAEGGALVVKQGPKGAFGLKAGAVHRISAPRIEVVDTIGAGDTFDAGYLAALSRGASLPAAMAAGVEVASLAISTMPRRYGP